MYKTHSKKLVVIFMKRKNKKNVLTQKFLIIINFVCFFKLKKIK